MTSLTVDCPLDPFARIEVRDRSGALVAMGVGDVHVDVASDTYDVLLSAAGGDVRRTVAVDAGEEVVVALDAPEYASAAPVAGTSTYVAVHAAAVHAASRRLARQEGPPAGIVVMIRRPGGVSPGSLPRPADRVSITPAGESGAAVVPLEWEVGGDQEHGDWAVGVTRVPAGTYVATIGATPSCLVVPTWAGWQTLLFIPVTAHGPVPSMAAMHAAPLSEAWSADASAAALSDRLHWAVLGDVVLPPRAVAMIDATSPLAALIAGAPLVKVGDDLDPASLPVLARDADRLLDAEIEAPGTITGPAVDAFAGRLSSPLWFRWRPSPARLSGGPGKFDDAEWRRRVGGLSAIALGALAEERPDDRVVARLLAYADEQSSRRGNEGGSRAKHPRDISEVVASTGVPAIGLLDALRLLPPPGRRPPWRAAGAVGVVVLAALLTWIVWPDEDNDIDVPTTVTVRPTPPTPEPSPATTATSPVTDPTSTTAQATTTTPPETTTTAQETTTTPPEATTTSEANVPD